MPLIPLETFEKMRKVRNIDAYSIDTNIFYACKFMFDKPPLKLHPIWYEDLFFVIPEIIYFELIDKYMELHEWINDILIKSRQSSLSKLRSLQQSIKSIDIKEECTNGIDNFLKVKNSLILNTSQYADFNQILKMYFETLPPFEPNNEKKHEFPDAIALATLEGYGEQMDRNILVISNDKGWSGYCDKSNRLFMIEKAPKGDSKILHFYNDILKPQIVNEAQLIENIRNILETSEDARETIKKGLQDFINENLHLFIPDVKKTSSCSSSYFYGEMKKADLLELDFSQLQLSFSFLGNSEIIAGSPTNARLSCRATIEKLEWDEKNKRGIVIESRTLEKEALVELYIDVIALINNHDLHDLTITGCDVFPDEVEIRFNEFWD